MGNTALLQGTMAKVHEAAPTGQHNQRQWGSKTEGCGTAYCYAGWLVVTDGGVLEGANTFRMPDGSLLHGGEVGEYAQKRLGLTGAEARAMFLSTNTIADLEYFVRIYSTS